MLPSFKEWLEESTNELTELVKNKVYTLKKPVIYGEYDERYDKGLYNNTFVKKCLKNGLITFKKGTKIKYIGEINGWPAFDIYGEKIELVVDEETGPIEFVEGKFTNGY